MRERRQGERRNPEVRRKIAEHYKRLEKENCVTEKEVAQELGVTIDVVKRLERESNE